MFHVLNKWKLQLGELYLFWGVYSWYRIKGLFLASRFEYLKNQKNLILGLLPTHNNMGDHAIAEASKRLLQRLFPEYKILELEMPETYLFADALVKNMNPDDMVFIIGGGNMGDMYEHEERTRRFIIRKFKKFRLVQLPQTVHFRNTESGQRAMKRSVSIYNAHLRSVFMARDKHSFNWMHKNLPAKKIELFPDIVLSLPPVGLQVPRAGIGVCFRTGRDLERVVDESFSTRLREQLENMVGRGQLKDVNTLHATRVNKHTRLELLNQLWQRYRSVELVITDRLHAMIFCVVTQTPCIVLPSFNHKVKEGFESLNGLNYIRYVEDPDVELIMFIVNEFRKSDTEKDDYQTYIGANFLKIADLVSDI